MNNNAKNYNQKISVSECITGLQAIVALASSEKFSVLLDSEIFYEMLVKYLDTKWYSSGASHLAFSAIYNLVQLNKNRIKSFADAGCISGLQSYYFNVQKKDQQKTNLTLSLLYEFGSPRENLEEKFVKEGGLKCVLHKVDSLDHCIVFLINFIHSKTKKETLDIILNNNTLKNELLSPPSEEKKKTLYAMLMRSISLHPNTSEFLLKYLPWYINKSTVGIVDACLGVISNLVITNVETLNFEKDLIKSKILLNIFTELSKSIDKLEEMEHVKNIWMRIVQILRQDICASSNWDKETLKSLLYLSFKSRDYLSQSIYFSQMISRYAIIFSLKDSLTFKLEGYAKSIDNISLTRNSKNKYIDQDFKPEDSSYFGDNKLSYPAKVSLNDFKYFGIMWDTVSNLFKQSDMFGEKLSVYNVIRGAVDDNSLCVVLSSIVHTSHPYIKSLFDESESDSFNIKIYHKNKEEWQIIKIDEYIPCYLFGNPVGIMSNNRTYWQLLIEKAFAKYLGSYNKLSELDLEDAIIALTGKKPEILPIDDKLTEEVIHNKIIDAKLEKQAIILSMDDKDYAVLESYNLKESQYLEIHDPDGYDKRLLPQRDPIEKSIITTKEVIEKGKAFLFVKL